MVDSKLGKLWSILSYIPPFFLLTLFWKKNENLVFFHAKQSTVIWLLVLIGGLLLLLPGGFFEIISLPITVVLWMMCLFFLICGLVNAIKGVEDYIPLMGEFADEFSLFKKIRKLSS